MGNRSGDFGSSLGLTELSKRLAQELADLPEHPAVIDVFDYLAGAIFSLKKCAASPFWNRRGGHVTNYKMVLSRYLSEIPEGQSPNSYWVSGYFVNSAMLRIAACYDRIPKMILKKKKGKAHSLMKSVWNNGSSYANWEAVYTEVNRLKHDATGLAAGRNVSRDKITGLSPFCSPHSLINQALQDYSSAALASMPGRLHENP